MKSNRLALAISAFQALSTVALLASSSWLIARASEQPNIVYLSVAIVGVRAFAISRAASRYADRIVSHNATFKSVTDLRLKVFKALVKLSSFRTIPDLDLLTRVVDDSQEKPLRIDPAVIRFITTLIFAGVIWFVIAPTLFPYLLAITLLSMALSYALANLQQKLIQRVSDVQLSSLSHSSARLIEHQPVLRSFGWIQQEIAGITQVTDDLNQAKKALALRSGWSAAMALAGTYGSVLLGIVAGAELLKTNHISATLFVVLVLAPIAIFEVLTEITSLPETLGKFRNSIKHLKDLFESVEGVEETAGIELENVTSVSANKVRIVRGNQLIRISDFKSSLHDTVGITGASGSGKTTFALLLSGLLTSKETGIEINGVDIAKYSPESLRKKIGLLEQTPTIFSGTVRANLLMAKPAASDSELIATLQKVKLWETFLNREGLETTLGETGSQISGGEAQRIALARILLADFQVVICDEPTSSVQTELAEELISEILSLSGQGKLVLLITHDHEFTARARIQVTASATQMSH